MSTPTCRTCDTKFPGKEVCKTCGADPNAEPTLDWKIQQAKAKSVQVTIKSVDKVSAAFIEMSKTAKLTATAIAKAFAVPPYMIVDRKVLVKERSARRARIRSLQNTKQGRRRYKHGRVGVR